MATLWCSRCLVLHGVGCTATHETEAGLPSCVFCLDGVPCPVVRRRERVAKQKPPEEPPPKADEAEFEVPSTSSDHKQTRDEEKSMETKASTHSPAATRVCARPGCTVKLSAINKSGKCAAHFHWKGTEKRSSSAGNGHAAVGSNNANGHARTVPDNVVPKAAKGRNGTNGTAKRIETLPDLAADRLDQ